MKRHKKNLLPTLLAVAIIMLVAGQAAAQVIVDKMVATVSTGVRTDLITFSDLLWQLALQPQTPLERPSSEELNRALNLIIGQRLILQEAERLPATPPREDEVETALRELIELFPSRSEFEERARRLGLPSERIRQIIRERLVIERYLDFRFRAFTIVTPEEVADYYQSVYIPRLRRQQPGRIIPTLEQARDEIERILTEAKVESDMDEFLEATRERAEIVILNPV